MQTVFQYTDMHGLHYISALYDIPAVPAIYRQIEAETPDMQSAKSAYIKHMQQHFKLFTYLDSDIICDLVEGGECNG